MKSTLEWSVAVERADSCKGVSVDRAEERRCILQRGSRRPRFVVHVHTSSLDRAPPTSIVQRHTLHALPPPSGADMSAMYGCTSLPLLTSAPLGPSSAAVCFCSVVKRGREIHQRLLCRGSHLAAQALPRLAKLCRLLSTTASSAPRMPLALVNRRS